MKNINRSYIKESVRPAFRNVTQIIKKTFMQKKTRTLKNYLTTEYWKLANKKLDPRISWSIKGKYKSYNPNSRRCSLCLHETFEIMDDPGEILLNKHSQVIFECSSNLPWHYIRMDVAGCMCS